MGQLVAAASVALGSALGALARVLVGAWLAGSPEIATALVNVLGAFLIGWLHITTDAGARWPLPVWARHMLLAGVLGGFTTFSVLSMQTLSLLQNAMLLPAAMNLFGSLTLVLLAVVVGVRTGERCNGVA